MRSFRAALSLRTPSLGLAALVVAGALAGCAAPEAHILVEVVDDEGNGLAGDDAIRVDCESRTLSAGNLGLDEESRFHCQTLNQGNVLSNDRVINFTITDEAGRFATHEEAAILEEGEVRTFSVQLERAAAAD